MDRRNFIQSLSGFAAIVLGREEIVRAEPSVDLVSLPYYEKAIFYGNTFKQYHNGELDSKNYKVALETNKGVLFFNTVEEITYSFTDTESKLSFHGGQIEFTEDVTIESYLLLNKNNQVLFKKSPLYAQFVRSKDIVILTVSLNLTY